MHKTKNKVNPFAAKHPLSQLKFLGIRQTFKILNVIAPFLASRLALRIFLTPPRQPAPHWQRPYITSAKQSTIEINQKKICLYEWGDGHSIVLLAHGWGGRGTQLGAFIEPLVQAGFRVIAFDGPAQGDSTGKSSNMFEFAALINQIAKNNGSLYAILGHSFGAACALLALHQYNIAIQKLVLIGCPSSSIWITENFAEKLAISKNVIQKMRELIQMQYGNQWTWDKLLSLKFLFKNVREPALIIHDQNDKDVPFSHAIELNTVGQASKLFTTKNQGHRRILRNPEVIAEVVKFMNH